MALSEKKSPICEIPLNDFKGKATWCGGEKFCSVLSINGEDHFLSFPTPEERVKAQEVLKDCKKQSREESPIMQKTWVARQPAASLIFGRDVMRENEN